MQTAWQDVQARARQPGSVVLSRWLAQRQAEKAVAVRNEVTSDMSISDFAEWIKGRTDHLGISTPRSAMCIGAVYACVALIAGAVASMPLKFYRRGDKNDREPYKDELWWAFNEQPYACWPAAVAHEYVTESLLLQGDEFWRIHRASRLSPAIAGFEPLHPQSVSVARDRDRLVYRITPQPAQTIGAAAEVTLDQDDVIHVPGPGFNGLRGLSQIASVLSVPGGIARAADRYAGNFFRNSARPDIILTAPGKLDQQQIDTLRNSWNDRYGGVEKSHLPVVASGGLDVKPITMNAEDSQLIETRAFQVEDIARIFGVPPFMIGHNEKTTSWGSGVEAMGIAFVKYTLMRHLVKKQQEINRKVFRTDRNFCEFDPTGLERGDTKSRNESYRIGLGRAGEDAWLTVNEVRRYENLPAVPGGDRLRKASDAKPATPAKTDPADPAADPAGDPAKE